MEGKSYVIGLDFGSDSVRAIIADTEDGSEIASSVFEYPRWKEERYCDKKINQFRHHPLDYIEGIEFTIRHCVQVAGPEVASRIRGIGVDSTGSTPVAVDRSGTPLALLPGMEENPNAMFILWKDHTSVLEAREINEHSASHDLDYLRYVGGVYSSEWFWAKLLHILRKDGQIRDRIYSWAELCDWVPYLLTGGTDVHEMKRSICAAGHKALYADEFGGLPPDEFFAGLDPLLKGFTARLFTKAYTSDQAAGKLSENWRKKLRLPEGVVVAVGAFDAHMGAVGGEIEPYYLSKVMGTSTCDILVVPEEEMQGNLVRGICGQVRGSVIPGMTGLEAGQSGFGDLYAWFRDVLAWPLQRFLSGKEERFPDVSEDGMIEKIADLIIPALSEEAEQLPLSPDSELALDWMNGRRTPDASQTVKGALTGLNLGSDAPSVFRSIVESTCFGAKAIIDRFTEEGIPVKGLIGLGGVARKSPFIMQMMADVTGMPIRIHRSDQTCALGAAMFAATAAGIFPKVEEAMRRMGQGFERTFIPDPTRVEIYKGRFEKYKLLGNFVEENQQHPPKSLHLKS